jgi:hypothetical protein
VSRNGNSLAGDLGAVLRRQRAVLDGEIVCLDSKGRSEFDDLLSRRGEPYFYAFDLIWCDGRDLRRVPLHERKAKLRTLIPASGSRLLYCDHMKNVVAIYFRSLVGTTWKASLRNTDPASTSPTIQAQRGSRSAIAITRRLSDARSGSNGCNGRTNLSRQLGLRVFSPVLATNDARFR